MEEADVLWESVTSRRYDFDARAREVEALEKLTLDEVAVSQRCITLYQDVDIFE